METFLETHALDDCLGYYWAFILGKDMNEVLFRKIMAVIILITIVIVLLMERRKSKESTTTSAIRDHNRFVGRLYNHVGKPCRCICKPVFSCNADAKK
jgi:hypothetical protein